MRKIYIVEIISSHEEDMFEPIFDEIKATSNAEARKLINKSLKSRNLKLNKDYVIGSIKLKETKNNFKYKVGDKIIFKLTDSSLGEIYKGIIKQNKNKKLYISSKFNDELPLNLILTKKDIENEYMKVAEYHFKHNPILKSDIKYYKGELKRTPFDLPANIWKKAYQKAERNGDLYIDKRHHQQIG